MKFFEGRVGKIAKKVVLGAVGTGIAAVTVDKVSEYNEAKEHRNASKNKVEVVGSESVDSIPIKTRDDFSGNKVSGLGAGYAKLEAQKTFFDFSSVPYGKLFDLYRYYFGQPLESEILYYSKHKPTGAEDNDKKYVEIRDKGFIADIVKEFNLIKDKLPIGKTVAVSGYVNGEDEIPKNKTTSAMGHFRIGHGADEKGEYISYYDIFDVDPGENSPFMNSLYGGKGFEIYGRIYLDFQGDPILE